MLKTAVDVATPVLAFMLLVIVGLELSGEDFRRVARRFRLVALATAAQVVLWPLAAALLLAFLPLPPYVGAGLLLVLPVLAGMFVRRARPGLPRRHGRRLLALSLVALAGLIALVVLQESERLAGDFTGISWAVTLLTAIMGEGGWLVGWTCRLGPKDRFALAMVLVVRNVAVATAVAVTVLGRIEFAVFATAYFLNQVPLLLAALVAFRLARSPDPIAPG